MNIPSGVINAVRAVRQVAGREGSDAINGFMGTPNYKPQGEGSVYSMASTVPNMPDVPSVHGIQQGAEAMRGAEHMMPLAVGYIGKMGSSGIKAADQAVQAGHLQAADLEQVARTAQARYADYLRLYPHWNENNDVLTTLRNNIQDLLTKAGQLRNAASK